MSAEQIMKVNGASAPSANPDAFIEPDPQHPGSGDARLRHYGVPVWALVGHARAIGGDLNQVATDYELPREAVEAAFAFYHQHQAVIDDRLEANEA